MKKATVIYRIFQTAFIGLLIVVLFLNGMTVYNTVIKKEQISMVFGFGSAIILSGSMEPTLMPDDVIIIKTQKTYKTQDIVTFKGNTRAVTHRIIDQNEEGFVTKGDGNNAIDSEALKDSQIFGKVIGVIPKAGRLLAAFQNPYGILGMAAALIAIDRIFVLVKKLF